MLSHNRQRGAGRVDDPIEVRVNQRLEPLRTQLLERRNIAVARVVHDDVETSECVDCQLHCGMGRILICHVQGSGAYLIARRRRSEDPAFAVERRPDQVYAAASRLFLMNANRSALIVSALVVGIPWGKPGYIFSVEFFTSFADSGAAAAIGTI
jgi:hypothetical protein